MNYRYELSRTAERYVSRVEPSRASQIRRRLNELCVDSGNPAISKALHGPLAGRRSSDLGNLRILYSVDDVIRIVDILNIGPRGNIYKR